MRRDPRRGRRQRILDVASVSVSFGAVKALDGVSLSVLEGQVVGLIGPNGAGKTTLFNVVSGFVRPDQGRVRLCGRRITDSPPARRAHAGMARTFQNVGLDKRATVRDNLRLAAEPTDIMSTLRSVMLPNGDALVALPPPALRLLHELDLLALLDEPVAHLPIGTAKLVELVCAMAASPRLLLLDEPSSGLGPRERHELGEVLAELRSDPALSVLMIEHDMQLAMNVSDYMYVLDFGSLLAEGAPAAIRSDPRVIDAYLGKAAS